MSRPVIGIDPGVKGGIVVLQEGKILERNPMPIISIRLTSRAKSGKFKTKNEVDGMKVYKIMKKYPNALVMIEDVKTIEQASKSNNFTLGEAVGVPKGIALGLFGRYYRAYSKTWQKEVLRKRDIVYEDIGETRIDKKATSLKAALRYFPDETFILEGKRVPHDGIYEGALMAVYGEKLIKDGVLKNNGPSKTKTKRVQVNSHDHWELGETNNDINLHLKESIVGEICAEGVFTIEYEGL